MSGAMHKMPLSIWIVWCLLLASLGLTTAHRTSVHKYYILKSEFYKPVQEMAECDSDDFLWPVSTNNQSTRGLRSNTGRGRSRGGWRGPSDDTNWRKRGGVRRHNQNNFNQEFGNKKNITVPSDKVGRIIGKGGRKIRELEYESKAKIKIGDSSGNKTTITLLGSPDATFKVEDMINKLLADRKPSPSECFNNSHSSGGLNQLKIKRKDERKWLCEDDFDEINDCDEICDFDKIYDFYDM